ncbi:MAG TPA: FAD:protein FMN transferase [Arenimonas sp.]|uniref:FAD:protein FMN transferase n=1 Tax=Arenimonas sp. TaxID=1872635 RepID=UPI002D7E266C|nr:FAD:protein FMN transferase [Arenimonas sp.]HEU0154356.1 FAD:protein FMN transferase [Arenimonas sp.]
MRRAASTSEPRRRPRLAALAVALCVLAGCRGEPPARMERLYVFGTLADVEIRGADAATSGAALAEISALLNQRQAEWHAWEPSDLTRINAALAAGESAPAPASVIALIERSRPLTEASEGLFDPALGGLVAAWGFHTSSFPVLTAPPTDAWLANWREHRPRLDQVMVDGDRVSSRNPAVQLDFGAIAEGLASETILEVLERHGIRHALVGLGGDIVALGDGGGRPWRVGLQDPFGGALGSVALAGHEALFSTGNYNKFRESPTGARWPHLLDPRSGRPARGAASVVVLHPDPVRADAAATALFVAGPSGFEHTARRLGLGCVLMVTEENEMLVSVAMAARVDLVRHPVSLGAPLDLGPDCDAGDPAAAD